METYDELNKRIEFLEQEYARLIVEMQEYNSRFGKLFEPANKQWNALKAECDKFKARAEALEKAIKYSDYKPVCASCERGNGSGCTDNECDKSRSGWVFDINRFKSIQNPHGHKDRED